MNDENLAKNAKKYCCILCNFVSSNKSNHMKHILTAKHRRMTNSLQKNASNNCECECGKVYKYRQGLFAHKKVCTYIPTIQPDVQIMPNTFTPVHIMEILKQNQETIINQNNVIMELSKNTNNSSTFITNNNTMNNQFNINMFLNEKCKDALNISDFMDTLQLNFETLEYVGTNGYVNGITKIIMDGLDKLDVYQRPIHCTDKKRETLYIKDNDVWEKDTDNKEKIHRFVGKVAKKNLNMVSPWQHTYPGIEVLDSPAYNLYMKIMKESINCGGRQEHADRNDNRIIKNILNRVYVDKHIETIPSIL